MAPDDPSIGEWMVITTLVDTNVLPDLYKAEPLWAPWSLQQLRLARTGVPPDCFIGAHAAAQGCTLLTRDAGRYRSYLPGIGLISPN